MELKNTTTLKKAEIFIQKKLSSYNTNNLIIKLRWSCGSLVSGKCKYGKYNDPYVITGCVDKETVERLESGVLKSVQLKYAIGTEQSKKGFEYINDVEFCFNGDELMVFIVGHELFHFLRKTKQIQGKQSQTQANKFGFEWVREFKETKIKMKKPKTWMEGYSNWKEIIDDLSKIVLEFMEKNKSEKCVPRSCEVNSETVEDINEFLSERKKLLKEEFLKFLHERNS